MHNGAYKTLGDAITQKIAASHAAKSGSLRSADAGLLVMNIAEEDVEPLAAFLKSLDDISPEEFAAQSGTGSQQ